MTNRLGGGAAMQQGGKNAAQQTPLDRQPDKTDDPLLDLRRAAEVLTAATGREVTVEHMRNARKRRHWPFFKDPLSGAIVIRQSDLLAVWRRAEDDAKLEAGRHDIKGHGGKR